MHHLKLWESPPALSDLKAWPSVLQSWRRMQVSQSQAVVACMSRKAWQQASALGRREGGWYKFETVLDVSMLRRQNTCRLPGVNQSLPDSPSSIQLRATRQIEKLAVLLPLLHLQSPQPAIHKLAGNMLAQLLSAYRRSDLAFTSRGVQIHKRLAQLPRHNDKQSCYECVMLKQGKLRPQKPPRNTKLVAAKISS